MFGRSSLCPKRCEADVGVNNSLSIVNSPYVMAQGELITVAGESTLYQWRWKEEPARLIHSLTLKNEKYVFPVMRRAISFNFTNSPL